MRTRELDCCKSPTFSGQLVRGTKVDENIFKWNVGKYLGFETWHGCGCCWSSALFLSGGNQSKS
jgi:hypothetical protein